MKIKENASPFEAFFCFIFALSKHRNANQAAAYTPYRDPDDVLCVR
jgi:hypothetical protein